VVVVAVGVFVVVMAVAVVVIIVAVAAVVAVRIVGMGGFVAAVAIGCIARDDVVIFIFEFILKNVTK
jgi:hypothetical protein